MAHPNNWRVKRKNICKAYGFENDKAFEVFMVELYKEGLSAVEIEEMILRDTGISYTARSIQRHMSKWGVIRDVKDAFRNAMKRGRVVWQLEEDAKRRKAAKHQISRRLRYEIMTRDGFTCVLCGAKEMLQIDHKIARVNGGGDEPENLRTLCIDCNIGKREAEGERGSGGGFRKA